MTRLNLLPIELKKEIELSKKNAETAQNLWRLLAFFFVMLGLLIIVGTFVKAKQTINVAEKEAAQSQIDEWKDVEDGAKDFASRLSTISKVKGNAINWNTVITEVSQSIPSNVRLSLMDMTGNGTKRVTFNGYAGSDKDVVTFRELLSKSKIFEFVDIESITEATDAMNPGQKVKAFVVTANLKAGEVKK